MESYRIAIRKSAAKEIEKLQAADRRRVIERIRALAVDPRPPGCKKLSGQDKYRLRQGTLRILYQIVDQELLIIVVKVGHRRDVEGGICKIDDC